MPTREAIEKVLRKYSDHYPWTGASVNALIAIEHLPALVDDLLSLYPSPSREEPKLIHNTCIHCGHCMDCPTCAKRPEG